LLSVGFYHSRIWKCKCSKYINNTIGASATTVLSSVANKNLNASENNHS
jgi:hypothetical protein